MLYLLLWFGSLQQALCLFSPHMDLQKIDEIMFNNAKYNVLKPTIHLTRDHFKDFIQQRDSSGFPGRKLFVDRNGIRHYWAGFEALGPKSLRKTILETNDIPNAGGKISTEKGDIDKDKEVKLTITKKPELNKVGKNKPLRKKKVIEPDDVVDTIDKLTLRKDEKNKVKTTFFCPFFGVITMVSYLD